MEELARFDTYLEMLDPMRGGYRCVMYDKELVDTFPKKSKTRIILDIDDGNIHVQAGIQSFGGGKYFSMIGKTKLNGHTYEQGQAISVVIYLDPNPLGVEIPEVVEVLLEQDEIIARVWSKLTDGRKRTICHTVHRIKNIDKQVDKCLVFFEEEREKLVDRGKW